MKNAGFDARTDTLIAQLQAATYLNDGLPGSEEISVVKGPWDAGTPDPQHFSIHVSRMGHPEFDYGVAGDPVIVTQQVAVACVTSYPAGREEMEQYLGFVAANTVRALLACRQVAGEAGWHSGVITESDAQTFRSQTNTTYEVEVFSFETKYEV